MISILTSKILQTSTIHSHVPHSYREDIIQTKLLADAVFCAYRIFSNIFFRFFLIDLSKSALTTSFVVLAESRISASCFS